MGRKRKKMRFMPQRILINILLFMDPDEWSAPPWWGKIRTLGGKMGEKATTFPTPSLDRIVLKEGEHVVNSKKWHLSSPPEPKKEPEGGRHYFQNFFGGYEE